MTIAEKISARYGNDGQIFELLDRVIDEECEAQHFSRSSQGDTTRYEFADSSAIIISFPCWDLGYGRDEINDAAHDLDLDLDSFDVDFVMRGGHPSISAAIDHSRD